MESRTGESAELLTGRPVEGIVHDMELMLMMEPRWRRFMPGAMAWVTKN